MRLPSCDRILLHRRPRHLHRQPRRRCQAFIKQHRRPRRSFEGLPSQQATSPLLVVMPAVRLYRIKIDHSKGILIIKIQIQQQQPLILPLRRLLRPFTGRKLPNQRLLLWSWMQVLRRLNSNSSSIIIKAIIRTTIPLTLGRRRH